MLSYQNVYPLPSSKLGNIKEMAFKDDDQGLKSLGRAASQPSFSSLLHLAAHWGDRSSRVLRNVLWHHLRKPFSLVTETPFLT